MRSGDLRKRVTLQRRDTTKDSYGQQVNTWADVATVWASIEGLSARELLAAQSVQSEVSHRITVRYRSELSDPKAVAAMRAVYNGRLFDISGAMNLDERNRTVELLCAEGLNNG
jgi:SPP1 family predicted phage head-tail adaptor